MTMQLENNQTNKLATRQTLWQAATAQFTEELTVLGACIRKKGRPKIRE